jgi:hypothetical protein
MHTVQKYSIEQLTAAELLDLLAELDCLRERAARRLAEITTEELLDIDNGSAPFRSLAESSATPSSLYF